MEETIKQEKCIPPTEKEVQELNEWAIQNLRDAKIIHLPPGIERAEVNVKSFLEINRKLREQGKCPMGWDLGGLAEIILYIIQEIKELKTNAK